MFDVIAPALANAMQNPNQTPANANAINMTGDQPKSATQVVGGTTPQDLTQQQAPAGSDWMNALDTQFNPGSHAAEIAGMKAPAGSAATPYQQAFGDATGVPAGNYTQSNFKQSYLDAWKEANGGKDPFASTPMAQAAPIVSAPATAAPTGLFANWNLDPGSNLGKAMLATNGGAPLPAVEKNGEAGGGR